MSKCSKFEDILARYLHGGVILQEREELEKHLSVCTDCEMLYEEMAEADRLLRLIPGKTVEPPAYLRGKILASLPEGADAGAWRRWGRWAAAFGAAAACGLLAVALYQGNAPRETRVASNPVTVRPAGQAPAVPAPDAPVGKPSSPAVAAPAKPSPGKTVVASVPGTRIRIIREVRIFFYYPPAAKVAVTGDFNGWNPEGVLLKSTGKPGLWETTLRLPPGAYSYNFIVDGNILLPDPNAPDQMPDGYGGTNSILLVKGGNSV